MIKEGSGQGEGRIKEPIYPVRGNTKKPRVGTHAYEEKRGGGGESNFLP